MALPEQIRVKVLSEAAGYVTATRVVLRDFTAAELMEALVAVAGKNIERLLQLLRAGTFASGDYRYRWEPIEAQCQELEPHLARFPNPCPDRPFEPARCVFARIRAGVETIEMPREQAAQRGFLKKQSFWDVLMQVASARPPAYQTYSYRDRADVYAFEPTRGEVERLRDAAALLPLEQAGNRIRSLPVEKIILLVNR